MVDHIVFSHVITDDILLPDGTQHLGLLGGAGTYAVAGARLWSNSVGIVSGIGSDLETIHGDWFRHNAIDTQGLDVRDEYTPRSWVTYREDGERTEKPQFGLEHFRLMEPWAHHLPRNYETAKAVYVFRDDNPEYWQAMFALKNSMDSIWVWEIAADAMLPSHWGNIARILPNVTVLSLNMTEGCNLFETDSETHIITRLLEAGAPIVVLRMGKQGVLVADANECWQIPSLSVNVVDPTGAGNAFTGGFLVTYCQTEDIRLAGICGNISASYAIQQYGPPPVIAKIAQQAHQQIKLTKAIPFDLN